MNWSTSDRAARLPASWHAHRQAAKTRAAGRCEATQHVKDCDGNGTDCDHITPGDNHHRDNLQWLSAACHKAKTAHETSTRNTLNATLRKRPQPQHPGVKQ